MDRKFQIQKYKVIMGYKYLCEILFFTKFYKYYDKTYYFVVDTGMLQILEV